MSRRMARQIAVQILFQLELGKGEIETAVQFGLEQAELRGRDVDYVRTVVFGTWERLEELDAVIYRLSRRWDLDRIASVDRAILRLAIFEIEYMEQVPAKVSVNEAVELAKTFSDSKSARYVNGLLGGFLQNQESIKTDG